MDILGKVPSPIIRYGLLVLFFVLSSAIFCLITIKYPDTVQLTVRMSPYTSNIFFSEITEEELNKIKIGQKVLISLKEYPQNSYGTWDGIIKSISSSPDAIFYKVKIEVSPYSVSTKGNELPPVSYAVWGTAVYNGDNKSFFERIFTVHW